MVKNAGRNLQENSRISLSLLKVRRKAGRHSIRRRKRCAVDSQHQVFKRSTTTATTSVIVKATAASVPFSSNDGGSGSRSRGFDDRSRVEYSTSIRRGCREESQDVQAKQKDCPQIASEAAFKSTVEDIPPKEIADANETAASGAGGGGGTISLSTKGMLTEGIIKLSMDKVALKITADGHLILFRKDSRNGVTTEKQITKAKVKIPLPDPSIDALPWSIVHDEEDTDTISIMWPKRATLRIMPAAGCKNTNLENHEDKWKGGGLMNTGFVFLFTTHGGEETSEVTVDMTSSGRWYGGGHLMKQHWPLNNGCWEVGPFMPFDNGPNGINTLIHPHWVTTSGLLVVANPDTPFLHVGMNTPQRKKPGSKARSRKWGVGIQNWTRQILPLPDSLNLHTLYGEADGQLHLQARSNYKCDTVSHPLRYWTGLSSSQGDPSIEFALSANKNVKEATRMAFNLLKAPHKPPPTEILKAPIWTTWARYHEDVDQSKVLEFASEIMSKDLPRSVMEIDDKWQAHYGDISFCPKKFPDPKAMVDELHRAGFKVTVWVMPFIEEKSEAYKIGKDLGYFIAEDETTASPSGGFVENLIGLISGTLKPGFFRWWHSQPVVALDVTNPEAVEWFVGRLRLLQETCNIDGFKFDAGEPCFLPGRFRTHRPISSPSEYTRLYVQEVASKFELAEVRTGHCTQSASLLTRMGDRFSTWDLGNGLQSIIPTLLTSSVLGYPFCLPDMVGGNAYFGKNPDSELMV